MTLPSPGGGARPTSTVRGGRRAWVSALASVTVAIAATGACGSDAGTTAPAAGVSSSIGALADVPLRPPLDDCPAAAPERLVPQVLAEYPHEPTAFTQGLLIVDGQLVEGTGRVGRSSVRRVDLATGSETADVPVPGDEFGEGVARAADGRLVQLTWRDGVAFVRDPVTLEVVERWRYDGEGWGLTTLDDGTFVMSDGTDTLTLRDATTFAPEQRVRVTRADGPTDSLNELEWDGERLWANRWRTDEIVRIDPRCGRVDAVVDATDLAGSVRARPVPDGLQPPEVLNGVAHVPGTDRYLVTGKLWPALFEVRFVPDPVADPAP